MATGIYKITNIINNKFYIGSTRRLTARKAEHKYRLKNYKGNSAIRSAVLKYGEENFKFEVIEEVNTNTFADIKTIDKFLSTREQFYVDTLHPEYNIRLIDITKSIGVCSEKQLIHLRNLATLPRDRSSYKKPIYQIDKFGKIIKEFRCAKDAEKELNLFCGSIYRVLSGEYSHTKNYHFKIKET